METVNTRCAAVTVSREETQKEEIQPEEITLEEINKDVENIQVECKKINCSPIMNVISGIYKLLCHIFKCFKSKKE